MRPSFVVSLLILSLFLTKAQGIRLEKEYLAARQHKQHDEESNLLKRNNSGDELSTLCKDEQCTGNVKNRKLFTTSLSAPHAISENVKTGGDEAHPSVNGNTRNNHKVNGKEVEIIKVNKQREEVADHEDLVDITDMDYSPARRKTPIHN